MKMKCALGAGAAMVLSVGASAQQAAPQSVQQQFDVATALAEKGDNAGALAAWETLEKRAAGNRRTKAIVLVRKSATLFALGRKDDAVEAARAGLAGLPASDATLNEDRFRTHLDLGLVAQAALDYASAADAFRQAEPLATTPTDKLSALLGLIDTQTFTDPEAATASQVRADAYLATIKVGKDVSAMFARQRGMLLLNKGDFRAARVQSMDAVQLLGGLTSRTDIKDVSVRSDVAIESMLAGNSESAREYMAYTGAGRLPMGSFDPAVQMRAPECGGDAGLKPADMAVVEFSIGDDGTVIGSRPVYAAGGGAVALEFARAVQGWSWTPDQIKQMPAFFRYHARIEMRCSTAFERPSIGDALTAALDAWLTGKGVMAPAPAELPDAKALPVQRAALAAAEAGSGANSLQALLALDALLDNRVLPREEMNALAQRALTIADANGAPPMARLKLDMAERVTERADRRHDKRFTRVLADMLTRAPYADDPQARAALRLEMADSGAGKDEMRVLLQAVADDGALAANDPLHVAALVRIASLDQQAGDAAAARAAFARTGLSADQCAIIDSPPHFVSAGGTFPEEAMRWGFEGWTQTQFDISADGKVLNERAILSYPPFIFSKAGTQTMAGARYSKSYRPDGSLGCGASTQRVKFLMGGH